MFYTLSVIQSAKKNIYVQKITVLWSDFEHRMFAST